MRILALDTSTPTGSVALAAGGEVTECRIGDADRTHGERLPGDVTALLAAHDLAPTDIDLYAVCSGPGSFTGLRVGLATIQALALVNRRPVVAVPTLEALACAAVWAPAGPERAELVGTWMNAHRGEVFAALYEVPQTGADGVGGVGGGALAEVAGPVAAPPDVVLRGLARAAGRRRPPGSRDRRRGGAGREPAPAGAELRRPADAAGSAAGADCGPNRRGGRRTQRQGAACGPSRLRPPSRRGAGPRARQAGAGRVECPGAARVEPTCRAIRLRHMLRGGRP